MLLVIDNYDSFTYNLVQYLGELGEEIVVRRNDEVTLDEIGGMKPRAMVISPGPGAPADAGVTIEAIRRWGPEIPTLGVCLGHQAIALACGQKVGRVPPMHGKVANIRHDHDGLFARLPSPFAATRYHSLAVGEPAPPLTANAWSEDGVVMAMRHDRAPVHGLQFHPESIASEHGHALLGAFLKACA